MVNFVYVILRLIRKINTIGKRMNEQTKNPFEYASEAEKKYIQEFTKFQEAWHKLYDYIKPFTNQNKEAKEQVSTINTMLIALPLSHLMINTLHMANLDIMKLNLEAKTPPLKIECPDCKKVIWDVTELKDFIYGKPSQSQEDQE